jgi:hypothetical protein
VLGVGFLGFPFNLSPLTFYLLFHVGFVPLTVAGQQWTCTTFPYRLAVF